MSLSDLQQYISAPYIYGNVTPAQINALTESYYQTTVNGIVFVGTNDPQPALAAQALS